MRRTSSQFITFQVEKLLQGAEEAGAVDVETIAREKLGILVEREPFPEKENIAGFIKREGKNGQPVIVLNNNTLPVRQRFTIAHEIGHFILHANEPLHIDTQVYFRSNSVALVPDFKEVEANRFAAELLMPKQRILEDLKKDGLCVDEKKIKKLAKEYEVSETAMSIRIEKLLKFFG